MNYRLTSKKQFNEELADLKRHVSNACKANKASNVELMIDALNDAHACCERIELYLRGDA